jgi:hypothetical protein
MTGHIARDAAKSQVFPWPAQGSAALQAGGAGPPCTYIKA